MAIVRLIFVTMDKTQADEAERLWKTECAPLMIRQPGCLSEELLRCVEHPGEYISYAEWDSQESIQRYLASPDHQQIVKHSKRLRSDRPVVKLYELV